jgi:D-xylose transport system permease protein
MAKTQVPTSPREPAVAPVGVAKEQYSLGAALRAYFLRVRGGDLGAMPAVLGFVVLFVLFSITARDANFLSTRNFANLLTQAAPITLIGVGLVFVLLLGEIDLSAGATAGVCAVSMAWLLDDDYSPWIALPAAIVIGLAIGALTGWLVAKVGIPSFVVTLAFFLSWQGVVLIIAKEGGTIAVTNDWIVAIANKNLSPVAGWILWAVVVAGFGVTSMLKVRQRQKYGLAANPYSLVVLKTAVLAVIWGVGTLLLNKDRALGGGKPLRGVPDAVPFILVIVVILTLLLTRTRWGRHIYAVGGNAEAARRGGINVTMVRLSGFVVCSTVAALGGMALASQLQSVSPQTGGNDTVLLAVAAAVIGGTSLFGGRGRVLDAVIGGLVVAIIPNGMALLGTKDIFGTEIHFSDAGPKFVVTGLILLLAASVDALSRKRATAH